MNPSEAKLVIDQLVKKIRYYSKLYYQSGTSPIEDKEFDLLMEELLKLESEWPELKPLNSPTEVVGGEPSNRFANIRHQFPMLSLSNIFTQDELNDWFNKVLESTKIEKPSVVCELKIDGLAISLKYQQGEFVQAITRGDGETGDDVTENVKTIATLPKKLPSPLSLEIRGEIYFTLERFHKLNEERGNQGLPVFKNPRNVAAGTIRMKDPREVEKRGLELFVYDIVEGQSSDSYSKNMDWLHNLGFPVHSVRSYCSSAEEIFEFCLKWEKQKDLLPFDIDGVVIKVDRFDYRKLLGERTKSPRWATAWKFRTPQARSSLKDIENSIGRSGVITPVAILDPVELLGTSVSRASLHNYDQIKRLDIHEGDVLILEKGGEIIPKIVGVDYSKRIKGAQSIKIPDFCPSCSRPLQTAKEVVDLFCTNKECPAIIQGMIEHFVSKNGMDIRSLGPALVRQLIDNKLIHGVVDIYHLQSKANQLSQLQGLGEKSIKNLFVALDESRTRPLHRLIFALGIPYIGERAAKIISENFGSLEKIIKVSKDDLVSLPEFGPIMTMSFFDWVNHQDNIDLIQELIRNGINPQAEKKQNNLRFIDQTVVITGTLQEPRKIWEERLESLGFRVSSSLSSKTDILLMGENPGSKLEKSKKLGVRICSESDILEMIQ